MDHHKIELVAELRRIGKENQKLKSMINLMYSNYHSLQALLMDSQEEHLRLTPKSMGKSLKLGIDIAEEVDTGKHGQQAMDYSVDSSDTNSGSSQEKNSRSSMGNHSLPTKKRKTNCEFDQSANDEGNSYMDEDLHNKRPHLLKQSSGYAAVPQSKKIKKILTVRTRSDATTVSDGCHWRKYGQKMTRNCLWPRSYYKCAALSCPVRKKVQRCSQDTNMVNTTYEGEHNHLLGPEAMAALNAASGNLRLSETSASLIGGNHLPFPSSIATISSTGNSPTITLDFTDIANPVCIHSLNPQLAPGIFLQ